MYVPGFLWSKMLFSKIHSWAWATQTRDNHCINSGDKSVVGSVLNFSQTDRKAQELIWKCVQANFKPSDSDRSCWAPTKKQQKYANINIQKYNHTWLRKKKNISLLDNALNDLVVCVIQKRIIQTIYLKMYVKLQCCTKRRPFHIAKNNK